MNIAKIPIEIMVVQSFAVASVTICLLEEQQHQVYAYRFDNEQFLSGLTIPGYNADDNTL
ncbi:MAG: hypothetical protein M3250_01300 [Thermoproteota archaeon]|nr:hypothetical protein [Thermoproteota archaeon]